MAGLTAARPNCPENKMGVMPVMKLIINMSLPMMFSMFIMALYNIVDSIFVAKISEDALTAVSLAFPVQNLMISFAVGTGVGVNALLSKRLGQRNQSDVNKTAMNAVFLALCNYAVFFIIGLTLIRPYLASQGVSDTIVAYGEQYLTIVLFMSFALFFGITFDRLLQSTGRTLYTMFSQLSGAVFNIIFDPLLIFGIGPFPKMGIRGAALATILGQILGFCVSVFCNLTKNSEIQFKLKNIFPEPRIIACSFIGAAIAITLSSVFQAFGSAVYSMIATFIRQLVVLLPVTYLLSLSGTIDTIWWAYLVAEVVSVVTCLFFMHRIYKKKIRVLPA